MGVQEQLEEALARIKVVEQERDAFKTAAENEEVARIAAEGRIPLPRTQDPNDEFASPPKKGLKKRKISGKQEPRYSLSTMEIESSVEAELETEELNDRLQWEKQRADRAMERIEFLEAECQMQCGPYGRPRPRVSLGSSQRQAKEPTSEAAEVTPTPVVEEPAEEPVEEPAQRLVEAYAVVPEESPAREEEEMQGAIPSHSRPELQPGLELAPPVSKKGPRRSTIFCPKEGIFRTVSEQEAEALEAQKEAEVIITDVPSAEDPEPPTPVEAEFEPSPEYEPSPEHVPEHELEPELETNPLMYARTPSVDPPTFALLGQQRTSLLSLLNAPHNDAHEAPVPRIPMVPDPADANADADANFEDRPEETKSHPRPCNFEPRESLEPRPHTSATLYTTVTTTIPLHDENSYRESSSSLSEKLRTPSNSSNASFDTKNPALTPTMTREQALAKIRERRGRARSAANGTATPHKKMIQGKDRRDMSAPTGRTGGKTRS